MSACYWYRSLARTFKSAPLFYAAYNDSLPIPNVGMLRDIRRIPFPSSGVLLQTLEGLASKDETKKIPLQNCRAVGWIGRKRNPPFFSVGRRITLSLIRPALCNIHTSNPPEHIQCVALPDVAFTRRGTLTAPDVRYEISARKHFTTCEAVVCGDAPPGFSRAILHLRACDDGRQYRARHQLLGGVPEIPFAGAGGVCDRVALAAVPAVLGRVRRAWRSGSIRGG